MRDNGFRYEFTGHGFVVFLEPLLFPKPASVAVIVHFLAETVELA